MNDLCISCGGSDPRCPSAHPEYGFTCILPDPHSGPHYDTGGGHWDANGQLFVSAGDLRDRLIDYIACLRVPKVVPVNGMINISAEDMADALLPFVRDEMSR